MAEGESHPGVGDAKGLQHLLDVPQVLPAPLWVPVHLPPHGDVPKEVQRRHHRPHPQVGWFGGGDASEVVHAVGRGHLVLLGAGGDGEGGHGSQGS